MSLSVHFLLSLLSSIADHSFSDLNIALIWTRSTIWVHEELDPMASFRPKPLEVIEISLLLSDLDHFYHTLNDNNDCFRLNHTLFSARLNLITYLIKFPIILLANIFVYCTNILISIGLKFFCERPINHPLFRLLFDKYWNAIINIIYYLYCFWIVLFLISLLITSMFYILFVSKYI